MAKFLFVIPDDQLEQLRAMSENTGISMGQYIRMGINHVLNNQIPCSVIISGSIVSGHIFMVR